MNAEMILGIESSCDESALALLDPKTGFSGQWVYSQQAMHLKYGGVVPDLASRDHAQRFAQMLETHADMILAQPLHAIGVT
ncbi:MAG TPA: tRNA (adenosine(37)-N6)-threonylcarbamoyltransferase complex transferase subunit TsaD, partial [Opitutales bacterium]|nr:tRNA (adenosine(37)-N6)-threonylcarbamoyltransferase complex transferase subunit TsaD [Opitutales bacterium]